MPHYKPTFNLNIILFIYLFITAPSPDTMTQHYQACKDISALCTACLKSNYWAAIYAV